MAFAYLESLLRKDDKSTSAGRQEKAQSPTHAEASSGKGTSEKASPVLVLPMNTAVMVIDPTVTKYYDDWNNH
jgi:hypothetical protein